MKTLTNTKTERQLVGVSKWKASNFNAGLQYCTGFGKTFTSILAIKDVQPTHTIVVVPTIVLKEQWEKELSKNFLKDWEVVVINTASQLDRSYVTDLLIIDEAHTSVAETFKRIFDNISYSKLLWLSATIKRLDGEEELLLEKAPICDIITLEECLTNNWISPYTIYNLEVPFSPKDQLAYNKADSSFRYYAMQIGYGNTFDTAKKWLSSGTKEEKGLAACYYNAMRKRKSVITGNSNKVQVTLDIINKFTTSKFIVFSEAISFVDEVVSKCNEAVGIHSKMTKKLQQEAMKKFKDQRTIKRGIVSCKSLAHGVDIPELDLGIIASFNSSKLVNTQSIGRILRIQEDKKALIINLYTPNSQEKNWLLRKQLGQLNIQWISQLNQIN